MQSTVTNLTDDTQGTQSVAASGGAETLGVCARERLPPSHRKLRRVLLSEPCQGDRQTVSGEAGRGERAM